MKRTIVQILSAMAAVLLFAEMSPALADPPTKGFVGDLVDRHGKQLNYFACDTLRLLRILYQPGKSDLGKMGAKFKKLARTKGAYAEPQCAYVPYNQIKVLEPPIFLGPIKNPGKDQGELFAWAVHVDNSPKGGDANYWVMYTDEKGTNPSYLEGVLA